ELPTPLSPLPSGSYAAWLGGYDDAADILYQTFTVPAGATNLTVGFYKWLATQETTTSFVYDRAFVELQTSTGGLLARYEPVGAGQTWSNLNVDAAWTPV